MQLFVGKRNWQADGNIGWQATNSNAQFGSNARLLVVDYQDGKYYIGTKEFTATNEKVQKVAFKLEETNTQTIQQQLAILDN